MSNNLPEPFEQYQSPARLPTLATICATWTDEQIRLWDEEWNRIHAANERIYHQNNQRATEWEKLLTSRGATPRTAGKRSTRRAWFTSFLKQMGLSGTYIPDNPIRNLSIQVDTKWIDFWSLGRTGKLADVVAGARKLLSDAAQKKQDQTDRETKLMALGEQYNMHPAKFSDIQAYYTAVEERARDEWVDKNFPSGTETEIDFCDGCSTWTVGDRRCECGNRRVYLTVGGDVVKGYYAYPTAD